MIQGVRILQLMMEARIEFVVVGGVAVVMHGSTLVTRDVDVCLRFDEKNLKTLAAILKPLNPKHRITPQRLPFEVTDQNWSMFKNLYLETDWGVLDCLGDVLGIGTYENVFNASISMELPGGTCRVLSLDALVKAKEAVGRPHDLAAVRQLKLIKSKQSS